MKVKVLLIAAAMLAFAAVSFGQVASLHCIETDTPLMTRCGGDVPIPEGTMIYWYLDVNGDGVDDSDPLLPVCPGEPCPQNSFLMDRMPMDGETNYGVPGTFYSFEYNWTYGSMPTINRVYLRVFYPNINNWNTVGGVRYTSNVLNPAFESNFDLAEKEMGPWTCTQGIIIPTCTNTPEVTLVPNNQTVTGTEEIPVPQTPVVHACASLCTEPLHNTLLVKVGPVVKDDRVPHVVITPGLVNCVSTVPCTGAGALNDMELLADAAHTEWTWVALTGRTGYYQALLTTVTEGCVTLDFDYLLPVEMGNVTVSPLSNAAEMKWNTRSEMNLARFEVVRDGEVIGIKAAGNTATGAEYAFVDETAENGHIYTYELVVVGAAGERDVVFSGKVSPSLSAAKPTEYALGQNFPNPFNPTTTISFDIVDTNPVTLMVYNANGQLVTTLLNNVSKDAGRYSLNFDASNLTSGLYFYTVKVGNVYTATKKMLLVK